MYQVFLLNESCKTAHTHSVTAGCMPFFPTQLTPLGLRGWARSGAYVMGSWQGVCSVTRLIIEIHPSLLQHQKTSKEITPEWPALASSRSSIILACEQALHLWESREVMRERHVKGDTRAPLLALSRSSLRSALEIESFFAGYDNLSCYYREFNNFFQWTAQWWKRW